jgi:hypothetical protein
MVVGCSVTWRVGMQTLVRYQEQGTPDVLVGMDFGIVCYS